MKKIKVFIFAIALVLSLTAFAPSVSAQQTCIDCGSPEVSVDGNSDGDGVSIVIQNGRVGVSIVIQNGFVSGLIMLPMDLVGIVI